MHSLCEGDEAPFFNLFNQTLESEPLLLTQHKLTRENNLLLALRWVGAVIGFVTGYVKSGSQRLEKERNTPGDQ